MPVTPAPGTISTSSGRRSEIIMSLSLRVPLGPITSIERNALLAPAFHFAALTLGPEYYRDLHDGYQKRRDSFLPLLSASGFRPYAPQGAYYVMAEFPGRDQLDDVAFARFLVESIGVAVVPASSFYRQGSEDASKLVRFCFSKQDSTLAEAGRRLARLV